MLMLALFTGGKRWHSRPWEARQGRVDFKLQGVLFDFKWFFMVLMKLASTRHNEGRSWARSPTQQEECAPKARPTQPNQASSLSRCHHCLYTFLLTSEDGETVRAIFSPSGCNGPQNNLDSSKLSYLFMNIVCFSSIISLQEEERIIFRNWCFETNPSGDDGI